MQKVSDSEYLAIVKELADKSLVPFARTLILNEGEPHARVWFQYKNMLDHVSASDLIAAGSMAIDMPIDLAFGLELYRSDKTFNSAEYIKPENKTDTPAEAVFEHNPEHNPESDPEPEPEVQTIDGYPIKSVEIIIRLDDKDGSQTALAEQTEQPEHIELGDLANQIKIAKTVLAEIEQAEQVAQIERTIKPMQPDTRRKCSTCGAKCKSCNIDSNSDSSDSSTEPPRPSVPIIQPKLSSSTSSSSSSPVQVFAFKDSSSSSSSPHPIVPIPVPDVARPASSSSSSSSSPVQVLTVKASSSSSSSSSPVQALAVKTSSSSSSGPSKFTSPMASLHSTSSTSSTSSGSSESSDDSDDTNDSDDSDDTSSDNSDSSSEYSSIVSVKISGSKYEVAAARLILNAIQDARQTAQDMQQNDQPDAVQPDAVQIDAVQIDAVQTDAVQTDAVQPKTAQPDAVQPDAVQPDAVQFDVVQTDAVQPDVVQPKTAQPDVVQPQKPAITGTIRRLVMVQANRCMLCDTEYADAGYDRTRFFDVDGRSGWIFCDICVTNGWAREQILAYLNREKRIPLYFLFDEKYRNLFNFVIDRSSKLVLKFYRKSMNAVYLTSTTGNNYAECLSTKIYVTGAPDIVYNAAQDIAYNTEFVDKVYDTNHDAAIHSIPDAATVQSHVGNRIPNQRCVTLKNLLHYNPRIIDEMLTSSNLMGESFPIRITFNDLSEELQASFRISAAEAEAADGKFDY